MGSMDCCSVARDRDRWRALVNSINNRRFPLMRGISWLAGDLIASQEGHCSVELVNQYCCYYPCHDSSHWYIYFIMVTAFRWFALVSLSPHKFVPSHGCCYRPYECKTAGFGVASKGLTFISNFVESIWPFTSWYLHADGRTGIDDRCRIACVLVHCKESRTVNINVYLTFWRRIFFLILAHPVFKMWVIQKPNKVALWNKRHFEDKRWRLYSMFKIFSMDICWINIKLDI